MDSNSNKNPSNSFNDILDNINSAFRNIISRLNKLEALMTFAGTPYIDLVSSNPGGALTGIQPIGSTLTVPPGEYLIAGFVQINALAGASIVLGLYIDGVDQGLRASTSDDVSVLTNTISTQWKVISAVQFVAQLYTSKSGAPAATLAYTTLSVIGTKYYE